MIIYGTTVLLRIHIQRNIPITTITEVAMNKLKFVIEVVDRVISVARLIKDAAELRKKEIEDSDKSEKS
jgi:hypothetical protein